MDLIGAGIVTRLCGVNMVLHSRLFILFLVLLLLLLLLLPSCDAWIPLPRGKQSRYIRRDTSRSQTGENSPPSNKKVTSVDVSDLGISMDQLYDPLDAMSVESRGSSKHFSWWEQADAVYVSMKHEGMRGQPAGAIDIQFTDTTVTVTIFGYIVWSGLLAGVADATKCEFEAKDDLNDNIPSISMKLAKRIDMVNGGTNRWDNFITDLGQDSILD